MEQIKIFSKRSISLKRTSNRPSRDNDRFLIKDPCAVSCKHYKPPHCMRIVLMVAMTNAEKVPNKMTEPANLNILPPTPKTNPSVRCVSHADMTAFPEPRTGTAEPAPPDCASRP